MKYRVSSEHRMMRRLLRALLIAFLAGGALARAVGASALDPASCHDGSPAPATGVTDDFAGGGSGRPLDILSWFDLEARKQTGLPSTFDAAHLYFIVNGEPRPDLRSYAEIEFENGLVADRTMFNGKLLIEQVWFRWDVKPLALKLGKFLLPSGFWVKNHWVPITPTVSSPLLYVDEIFPEKGVGVLAERSVTRGRVLRTESYYICNGRGPREFYADNDGDKALGADCAFQFSRGGEAGVAFYEGIDGYRGERERIASLYGRVDRRRLQVTVEASADAGPVGKYAWYLQPQFKLSERTKLTLRGETRRLDRRIADTIARKWTLAHARQFNENLLLKTEISRRTEDDPARQDSTGFLSSISVIF